MIERPLCDGAVDVHVYPEPAGPSDAIVQRVLAQYGNPAATRARFARDARGRPIVRGSDSLRISVSHTKGALLVAIGARCRLGVDVELIQDRGLHTLQRHALTGAELDELGRVEACRRTEAFLGYWARKEALLKAARVGLAVEPRLIELPPPHASPHPVAVPESLGLAREWWIVELDLDGYAAALATDVPHPRVRVLQAGEPNPTGSAERRRRAALL